RCDRGSIREGHHRPLEGHRAVRTGGQERREPRSRATSGLPPLLPGAGERSVRDQASLAERPVWTAQRCLPVASATVLRPVHRTIGAAPAGRLSAFSPGGSSAYKGKWVSAYCRAYAGVDAVLHYGGGKQLFVTGMLPVRSKARRSAVPVGAPT